MWSTEAVSSSTFSDECNSFCTCQQDGNSLQSQLYPVWGELSWSQLWGIDSKQTALREYWCVFRAQPLKDLPMLLEPFERFLWWAPMKSYIQLFISLYCTAPHFSFGALSHTILFFIGDGIHAVPESPNGFVCHSVPSRYTIYCVTHGTVNGLGKGVIVTSRKCVTIHSGGKSLIHQLVWE